MQWMVGSLRVFTFVGGKAQASSSARWLRIGGWIPSAYAPGWTANPSLDKSSNYATLVAGMQNDYSK
jgi:hypothetical protein